MKKIILSTFILFALNTIQAQQLKGQKVASVKLGFSATGLMINAIGSGSNNSGSNGGDVFTIEGVTTNKFPAISATFDYGITDMFSIGGLASYQAFSGTISNYIGIEGKDTISLPKIDFNLRRIYVGFIPKIHWKTENDNTDLYSAVRVGYVLWANHIEAQNNKIDALNNFNGGRPAIGIVPIGVNFYFNEYFGGNAELAIAAPYLLSIGACYRF
jgi:hypothetical protein